MTIDWRELNVDCPADEALRIAHEVANEAYGTFEINYVDHKDYGDYSAEHDDPYEAEIWASDYEFHGEAHDNSLTVALMKAVIAFLKDKEFKPARAKESVAALDKITPFKMKALLKGEIERRTSKLGQYSKYDLIEEIRKAAGLSDRETDKRSD
jgi:hypothetical protein